VTSAAAGVLWRARLTCDTVALPVKPTCAGGRSSAMIGRRLETGEIIIP